MDFQTFGRQTWALTKKNLLITVTRKWFSTLLRSLVFPILVLVLLLEVQNFTKDNNRYGISNPRSIRSLADSMAATSKPLILVQEPDTVGPDFQPVLEKITKPLDQSKLIYLEDSKEIDSRCPVDYNGNSPCHAVVIFKDSPLSGHVNATWNYTIRTDPSLSAWSFNVFDANSATDKIYLPLQLAIENAMLNLTVNPDFMSYTGVTQAERDEASRKSFIAMSLYLLSFAYYITLIPVSHHVASMMSSERESGMSALIDAMGGGVAWPRVISYVITFDILYLPLWIIMGSLYWNLLFPGQSAAIPIFWQIFTGWATTSASVFGTAFFKRSAFATLWVSLIPWLLAICAAFTENLASPGPLSQVVALSFFFPSMNYIYFFNAIAKSELAGVHLNLAQPLESRLDSTIAGQARGLNWVNISGPYFLWIILAVQIIVYALLAVLVEILMHGNNRHRRTFSNTPGAEGSHIAIETMNLEKHYRPSWYKKFFCCARTPSTKAVDGLNLVSQKRQILCLLGPNGSGKTTTLDMLAGFQAPTGGSVNINASPSQLGICPQRNVLWDNLTVYEHLQIWNILKGNTENPAALEQLIDQCDLIMKRNSLAKNLSGGMKRKLQLACMLVGGSSICLMDEVTSGLDPLSRRAIWNVVLSERSRRTMVLTTHFLDECEVLSDHIVIITLGKLKCQGTPTELKNQYGGGYRVHIPKTEDISAVPYPVTEQHDRFICRTPDSTSAAQLLASLKNTKDSELYITGPTIEDVFLKVSEEPHTLIGETPEEISVADSQPSGVKGPQVEPPLWVTYSQQFLALFLKRIQVLRSNWWAYFFALGIPLVATHFIGTFLDKYQTPDCRNLIVYDSYDSRMRVTDHSRLTLGPQSINQTVAEWINATNTYYYRGWGNGPYVFNTRGEVENFVRDDSYNISYGGGLWLGNDSTPLIVADATSGANAACSLMNLANQIRSNTSVAGYTSQLVSYHQAEGGQSMFYVTIFCLLQMLYPAFFSLYPTYERRSQVRALQYSNGIRPFPLLFSYWMFDFVFVLIIAAGCTAMIAPIAPWFGIGYVWFIQVLYGLAATLSAYLISLMARSQPAAFGFSVLLMAVMYALSVVTLLVIQMTDGANQMANDGTAFGLGLIFPIQNLMRGLAVSLNMYIVRCRGQTMITDPSSIYAFGGPIMLLILQIIGLFCLLLWLEGGSFAWIMKPKPLPPAAVTDAEKSGFSSGRPDVDAETARVESSDVDLLRALHVSKRFGNNVAVDDVSLGLRENEILALLGPNGAGKTTMINMIRGDMTPSRGRIFLEGVDVLRNKRLAQKHLGVCPQFDALDLLTVREHLMFYARCKGVEDIRGSVAYVMARVGITAHSSKLAHKLSGGNKRKLSLAIALLGDPPVLLLDEPSSAMDAASKRVLWRTLAAVAPGRSVLLTTHSMEEADALATRAAIVARRVLAVGTTEALRKTHSNEYHVHLILKSAPLSTATEMRTVEDWARRTFADAVRFEGESLGGQVRFVVPADTRVPTSEADEIEAAAGRPQKRSFTRYLIETLEARKEELGIDCYSISAATMESVFMKVVKEGDVFEDAGKKKGWWPF